MRAPCIALCLAACVLAAGCTTPDAAPTQQLLEAIAVGHDLGAWDFPDVETQGIGPNKQLRTTVAAPPGIASIGLRVIGIFKNDNASIRFRLDDPGGETVLDIPAANGLADDHGTIRGFFALERVLPSAPGNWSVRVNSTGAVGQLGFSFWGIPAAPDGVERTFVVREPGLRPLVLEVFATGWGSGPSFDVTAPDGSTTSASMALASDDEKVALPVQAGTYTVAFNVTGWGGSLRVLVRQG